MTHSQLISSVPIWIGIACCITQSAIFSGLNLAIFSISTSRQSSSRFSGKSFRKPMDEGETIDPRSVITLPIEKERPLLPKFDRSPSDPFLQQLNASGKKWVIIIDTSGRPSFVLDAHHFLRDSLFNAASADPKIHWHRPIIVTDLRTPLGSVIGRMRTKPKHPEDDVIDDDLILVWGEQRRIITGADLLGRLLRGIVTQDGNKN